MASAIDATKKAMDPKDASIGTLKIENTLKRDTLIEWEKKYQHAWQDSHIFQADAPSLQEIPFHSIAPAELRKKYPKFMCTMAYPYVNGTPHAGHSFTASKLEFAIGWARMKGQRALYPQGYHCTGMPIKACADKLVREIEEFGQEFESCPINAVAAPEEGEQPARDAHTNGAPPPPAPTQETTREDVTKFTAKKSKAAAKTNVNLKYQFQIMLAIGIPLEEIHRFADPQYWLEYFPPLWKRDLTDLGCRVDWRRSFVTTDANPYYDSFVRWQMKRLKEMGKIRFGKRYTVYSPKDGQACMDHDRQTGEGIGVQEYTAMKLRVLEWPEAAKKKVEGKVQQGGNVYFVPATLRPETMYGQNCCFVGPNLTYGIYEVKPGKEYYFISERAARNMAFQSIFPKWGVFPKVAELRGSDVIGTLVNAPLSAHKDGVRILPMESVKASKGTGVVTSVPSDSPDDYATTLELAKKADFYKIKREWIDPDNILPIIETPAYGNLTAKYLVESMKINSPKDAKQLDEAKKLAYSEGYYKGKMIYGDFAGKSVEEAKPLVRQQLIDSGDAFNYAEPDGEVISRSGDICVAGHLDQWFMNYGIPEKSGDAEWQPEVLNHMVGGGVNTFSTEVKNAFEQVLVWLAQWACARSYGLGTKLPWDESQLVESLSDSTIYMAYYTFAHLLHSDIFGKTRGPADVGPEEMTDEIWDWLFCRTEHIPASTTIKKETLHMMRREFEYWYPLDQRCSGKDLIQNHLTFFLYVHIALFPREYWPKAIRVNGHLMLNGEKMSKSTGNFLTLADAVRKFGADATRVALADAGDGIEDANFEETVANANILRLYELRNWCKSVLVTDVRLLKEGESYAEVKEKERHANNDAILRTGNKIFWDEVFENELRGLVKEAGEQYEGTSYKAAIKSGFYDFIGARDFYREATKAAGVGMHVDCVKLYVEMQALMVTVVAPHWAEYIWLEVLGKQDSVQNALFPEVEEQKADLTAAREYVRSTSSNITSAEGAQLKKMSKGKVTSYDPKKEKRLSIFCARKYPAWQDNILEIVRQNFQDMKLDLAVVSKSIPKAESKKAMPFVQQLKKNLESGVDPQNVFDRKLPFDEVEVLREMVPGLKQTILKCHSVEVTAVEEGGKSGSVVAGSEGVKVGSVRKELPAVAEGAVPGQPTFYFENV